MSKVAIFPVMSGRNGGGPETYERELVRGLSVHDHETDYRITCLNSAAAAALETGKPNFRSHVIPGGMRPLAMAAGLPWVLKRESIDFMHAAYIPPPWSPVPYVFTLHCSSPFATPELFPPAILARLKFLLARGMRDAAHVICVSQDVLERAAEHYKLHRARLSVVHNGVGAQFQPTTPEQRAPTLLKYGLTGRYVLSAARFEKRKNLSRLLEAFAQLRATDPGCVLALAGDMTWEAEPLARKIRELGLADAVVRLGYVRHDDMPHLYGGAVMFAFPSLWEGFGIPVLEAMACGAPVLTSNTSSLPEVAGGAALTVNPLSVDEITAGLCSLAHDAGLRARLSAAGLERARQFSWERTATETLAVYRRVMADLKIA